MKPILFFYDLEDERILLCPFGVRLRFFIPLAVAFHEAAVNHFLRLQTRLHRLVKGLVSSQIEAASLETDIYPVAATRGPVHAAEAAGIVAAVFPLLQPLNAGTVHPRQPVPDAVLHLPAQAAAAFLRTAQEGVPRDLYLFPAVTTAVPVHRRFFAFFFCGRQRHQPSEPLSGKVVLHVVHPEIFAATARCPAGFQAVRRYDFRIAAVAEAVPVHMPAAALRARLHRQMSKLLTGEVGGGVPSPRRIFRDTAAVRCRAPLQILCVRQRLLPAVTAAAPDHVAAEPLRCLFQHGQMTEPLSNQIFTLSRHNSYRHFLPSASFSPGSRQQR